MERLFGYGHTLKDEIKRHGRTQKYVAAKMGIPIRTFESWIADRIGIPKPTLMGILAAFPEFDKKLFPLNQAIGQQSIPFTRKGVANG